jgi:hypothetical protein
MTSGGSIAGSIRLSNASKLRVETVSTVNPIRFINLPPSRQSPTSGTKNSAGGQNPMRILSATACSSRGNCRRDRRLPSNEGDAPAKVMVHRY